MRDAEYENNKRLIAYAHLEQVKKAPLAERKEAAASFAHALRDPKLIAERISWLIAGNYGYGAMLYAKQALNAGSRANKAAQLVSLVASFEWMCPADLAIRAWKEMTLAEKNALANVVKRVIERAKEEE